MQAMPCNTTQQRGAQRDPRLKRKRTAGPAGLTTTAGSKFDASSEDVLLQLRALLQGQLNPSPPVSAKRRVSWSPQLTCRKSIENGLKRDESRPYGGTKTRSHRTLGLVLVNEKLVKCRSAEAANKALRRARTLSAELQSMQEDGTNPAASPQTTENSSDDSDYSDSESSRHNYGLVAGDTVYHTSRGFGKVFSVGSHILVNFRDGSSVNYDMGSLKLHRVPRSGSKRRRESECCPCEHAQRRQRSFTDATGGMPTQKNDSGDHPADHGRAEVQPLQVTCPPSCLCHLGPLPLPIDLKPDLSRGCSCFPMQAVLDKLVLVA